MMRLIAAALAVGSWVLAVGNGGPVGRRVDIGGRGLHLVCVGSGFPTVVFESGAADGFYTWWLVQNELRSTVRTCSYDRAGFGWSDPTPSRSMAGYVDDLHELLHRAGEKPPFIMVGHSMGGSLVQRYYWRYPAEVRGIVAVDPLNAESSVAPFPEMAEAVKTHRARRTKEMEQWRANNSWPVQDFPSELPRELRDRLIARSTTPAWWEARFAEGALPDLDLAMTAEQRRINVPLTVITATKWSKPPGWSDETMARYRKRWRDAHDEIASRSPKSRMVKTETGHEVPMEAPKLIADEIRKMIGR